MSINSVGYNTSLDVLAVKADTTKAEKESSGKSKTTQELLDSVSLSSMSDKLSRLVKGSGGTDIITAMTEDLHGLQSNFMQALSDKLKATGIDVTQSFLLKKGEDGTIMVDGTHPDKAAIEAALNTDETLKSAFDTISEQAELLGSVTGNSKYKANSKALGAYQAQLQAMSATFLLNVENESMTYGLASYL